MSPLLTGLAKLTPEEMQALMDESERLVRLERQRVLCELEWALTDDGLNMDKTPPKTRETIRRIRGEK